MNSDNCPGNTDPKVCQEKGGSKVELRKVWDKIIENLEKIQEGEPEECDYVELSGFPTNYTEDEVDIFLKSNGVKFIQDPDEEIVKGDYPGTFIIHDPSVTDIKDLLFKVSGRIPLNSNDKIKVVPVSGENVTDSDDIDPKSTTEEQSKSDKVNEQVEDNVSDSGDSTTSNTGDRATLTGEQDSTNGLDIEPAPSLNLEKSNIEPDMTDNIHIAKLSENLVEQCSSQLINLGADLTGEKNIEQKEDPEKNSRKAEDSPSTLLSANNTVRKMSRTEDVTPDKSVRQTLFKETKNMDEVSPSTKKGAGLRNKRNRKK